MPVFGLGTWEMGGRMERDETHDARDIEAIKKAIKSGITHIDTAEKYAAGHAEELVGQAIVGEARSKLFLVSKVADGHHSHDGVNRALEGTLKRLGTDYLDLYLLHAPDQNVHIRETMRAMNSLVKQGLVKNIGVSNFSVEQFKMAQEYSEEKLVANQLHYNLHIRELERSGALQYYQENDVLVIAWRPLQKNIVLEDGKDILTEVGRKHDKTPAQVAINWLLSQKNIVTMSTMRDSRHLEENLGAVGWALSNEDTEYLRESFPDQKDVSDVFPLPDWKWE